MKCPHGRRSFGRSLAARRTTGKMLGRRLPPKRPSQDSEAPLRSSRESFSDRRSTVDSERDDDGNEIEDNDAPSSLTVCYRLFCWLFFAFAFFACGMLVEHQHKLIPASLLFRRLPSRRPVPQSHPHRHLQFPRPPPPSCLLQGAHESKGERRVRRLCVLTIHSGR